MTIERLIKSLIQQKDKKYIFKGIKQDGIELGSISSYDPDTVIQFMNIWCNRIDSLINLDKEINGGNHSWKSHFVTKWRGFTYNEFQAIFNTHIQPDEFSFYPVFSQLSKRKGGVKTEKQRADITFIHNNDKETYLELLKTNGFDTLLKSMYALFNEQSNILPLNKLKQHTYICSPTGTGKSELLRFLFHQMVNKYPKYSFILIDPHGSLANDVKKIISVGGNPERLIYIEPFLKEGYSPTFNPFEIQDTSTRNITFTAEQIIFAIEETLSREGGNLTEVQMNMLEKCVYVILARRTSTILDLVKLLNADEELVNEAQHSFPLFFNDYYRKPNNKTREALVNRISRFLNSPILQNLIGGKSTFNLESIVNSGKILVVNLGDAGEMTQIMFGKFLIASIKSIIRKRKKNDGLPTFLFVDEVQSMMSGSFDQILSQLRGFGLHCIMANQYLSQLNDQVETVMQNTAIKIGHSELKKSLDNFKNISLRDYEFFLNIRGQKTKVFKSPNTLIKYRNIYEINKEEEKELNEFQIKKYYRKIDQIESNQQAFAPIGKRNIESKISPRPPYQLQIED